MHRDEEDATCCGGESALVCACVLLPAIRLCTCSTLLDIGVQLAARGRGCAAAPPLPAPGR